MTCLDFRHWSENFRQPVHWQKEQSGQFETSRIAREVRFGDLKKPRNANYRNSIEALVKVIGTRSRRSSSEKEINLKIHHKMKAQWWSVLSISKPWTQNDAKLGAIPTLHRRQQTWTKWIELYHKLINENICWWYSTIYGNYC